MIIIVLHCFLFFLVHKDGEVCISILHEPGEDKFGYERASERWLPIHTVESILMSVISMISDPNDESPANVDAAVSTALFSVISQVVISFPSCKKIQDKQYYKLVNNKLV